MRIRQAGLALTEVVVALAAAALLLGIAAPGLGAAVDGVRAHGAVADLYAAVHLTRSYARMTKVTHALVLEPGGRGFRIVVDPGGTARTVHGPHPLPDGAVATANATIRFSANGFAIPAGTLTIRSGADARRVVVNLLGRARIAFGEDPA
jgi:type IV fimbrial biogenesis protein FimT